MSTDVARAHGGDASSDPPPDPTRIPTTCKSGIPTKRNGCGAAIGKDLDERWRKNGKPLEVTFFSRMQGHEDFLKFLDGIDREMKDRYHHRKTIRHEHFEKHYNGPEDWDKANPNFIESWKEYQWKKSTNDFVNDDARKDDDKLKADFELQTQQTSIGASNNDGSTTVDQVEVLQKVLGQRRGHERGVGRKLKGSDATYADSENISGASSSQPPAPTHPFMYGATPSQHMVPPYMYGATPYPWPFHRHRSCRIPTCCSCFPVTLDRSRKNSFKSSKSSKSSSNNGSSKLHSDSGGKEMKTKESSVVACFGEMLIDFVPTVSGVSLAEAEAFKKAPGGAPANVAVGISRLEGSSAFIGKVGDDEFGHMLSNILKDNNVDNSGIVFDPNARTALAFVTLTHDGEREFLFFRNPSADMLLTEAELNANLIKKAGIFHYGSISLIDEPCRSAHYAAMEMARTSGCLLSYDPNLRLPLWPSAESARQGIMSIWDKADIIKINKEEITFLTEGDDPCDHTVVREKLFHPNLKLLIVTEGTQGCRYYTKEFNGHVAGVKVTPVDTTGAGDGFVAGVLSIMASDLNLYKDEKKLREALLFANACGALTVTERGAIPALPTKEAVLQILEKVNACEAI
ncbi:probable fructokinase-7 [Humulus lupulus]|uniref:probable fructokinase-7 n=1 Tax=Humulus lupulus TaxID=3486 RepID=UPI002B40E895|nr:probable fructokinase-7 [Humulus lupulus]